MTGKEAAPARSEPVRTRTHRVSRVPPALFLAGRSGFEYVIFGRLTRPRLIGVLLLAIIAAIVVYLPPTITSAAATLVLAGVAAFDTLGGHRVPPEPPSPPA